ncbi:MAG: hypothetical protein ABIE74_00525, partial [Pseudomonadota bacterium]
MKVNPKTLFKSIKSEKDASSASDAQKAQDVKQDEASKASSVPAPSTETALDRWLKQFAVEDEESKLNGSQFSDWDALFGNAAKLTVDFTQVEAMVPEYRDLYDKLAAKADISPSELNGMMKARYEKCISDVNVRIDDITLALKDQSYWRANYGSFT